MVLFKLTPPTNEKHQYHWTEIYTIVTILTTFIEYIRRVCDDGVRSHTVTFVLDDLLSCHVHARRTATSVSLAVTCEHPGIRSVQSVRAGHVPMVRIATLS